MRDQPLVPWLAKARDPLAIPAVWVLLIGGLFLLLLISYPSHGLRSS